VKGTTLERWEITPSIPKPVPKKVKDIDVERSTDTLMSSLYGTLKKPKPERKPKPKPNPKPKKERQVVVKHTPTKSMFEDSDEGKFYDDLSDLGFDLPKGDDW
jgi:hypothetical protein